MAGSNNCEVEIKDRVFKKCKPTEEWEDEELSNSLQEKMSLQNQTLNHTLHISDAKLSQKSKESSTRGQQKRASFKKLEANLLP